MLFSSQKITKLLISAVENDRLDQNALKGLLYYLNFPDEEIPIIIAEKIIDEPDLITNQEILGKRLAFGHVQELSDLRNPEHRANRQIRICRQLNRIALFLEEHKAPASIINDFSKLCQSFISTMIFFEARKQDNKFAFAAEEVILIEQIISSILSSKDLSLKFYENLFNKLGNSRAKTLATSLLQRLHQTLEIEEDIEFRSILNPNSNPPISKELESCNGFIEAVEQLKEFLSDKSGKKSDFH